MLYFAYGSNMNPERMKGRNINFSSRKFAKLIDYKLVFNKKSKYGDFTFANIVKSNNDYVEGALYEFPDIDIIHLDNEEGYPNQYDKKLVQVTDLENNLIEATTYIANKEKIVNALKPKKEYLYHLLAGRDILTDEYYAQLSKTETCD
ncbi:MAG: gamma-glutamylcyclotransferase [Ignavibacteriae bacterium]|nr:gamma-glutamylcyclotransferase [Ignavibacteriota bacterium]